MDVNRMDGRQPPGSGKLRRRTHGGPGRPPVSALIERVPAAPIQPAYDVVVVGARCAGAATALGLARAGRTVLLIDKGRYGSDMLSTHALTRTAVQLLHRWGVLDGVRAVGTPRVSRVAQHYGDNAVDIAIRARAGVDGLYAPRRFLLDRLLVDAARAAGADVRHQTTLRGLTRSADGRVDGVVLTDGDGTHRLRADLVVGADGRRSVVAEHAGASLERRAHQASAAIYTYLDGLPADAYHNYFRDFRAESSGGAVAGLIPTAGGLANVWVGFPSQDWPGGGARLAPMFERVLAAAAPELFAQVASRLAHQRFSGYRGEPGYARQAAGPGWALVGDAATYTDPVGAHGITDAFVAAEVLSHQLAHTGITDRSLADYQSRRREMAWPVMSAIERIASFAWDLPALQQAHLDLNDAMRYEGEAIDAVDLAGVAPIRSRPRPEAHELPVGAD